MAQQILLIAGKRGKLLAGLALLALIGISVIEILHPGTIGFMVSLARRGVGELVDDFGALIDSLIELKRTISNWL